MSRARGKQPEFQKPPLPDFLRRMQQTQEVTKARPMPEGDAPGREDELPSIVADGDALTVEEEQALRLQHGLPAERPVGPNVSNYEGNTESEAERRLREPKKDAKAGAIASFGKAKKRRVVQIGGDHNSDEAEDDHKASGKTIDPSGTNPKLVKSTAKRKRMAMSFE